MSPKKICSFLFLFLIFSSACNSDNGLRPLQETKDLLGSIVVSHKAITMSVIAPFDTLTLAVRALDMKGEEWSPSGISAQMRDSILRANPPRFRSTDETKVMVSPNGTIRAISSTPLLGGASTVRIVVSQTLDGITRLDTAFVRVPPAVPSGQPFSLEAYPDSFRIATGSVLRLPMAIRTKDGSLINNSIISVTSENGLILSSTNNYSTNLYSVTARSLGVKTRIVAEALVYGVNLVDTLEIETIHPLVRYFAISLSFLRNQSVFVTPPTYDSVTISTGGNVDWGFSGDSTYFKDSVMSVVFDDPRSALSTTLVGYTSGDGNIISTLNSLNARRFITRGRYPFVIEPYGFRGVVIVK